MLVLVVQADICGGGGAGVGHTVCTLAELHCALGRVNRGVCGGGGGGACHCVLVLVEQAGVCGVCGGGCAGARSCVLVIAV